MSSICRDRCVRLGKRVEGKPRTSVFSFSFGPCGSFVGSVRGVMPMLARAFLPQRMPVGQRVIMLVDCPHLSSPTRYIRDCNVLARKLRVRSAWYLMICLQGYGSKPSAVQIQARVHWLRTILRIALFESLVGAILLLLCGGDFELGRRRGKVSHSCETGREEFERTSSTHAVNWPHVHGCALCLVLIATHSSSKAKAVYCRTLQLCNIMALLSNVLGFSALGLAARLGQLSIQRKNPFTSMRLLPPFPFRREG